MVTSLNTTGEKILGYKFTGKLHDEDYRGFVPALEEAIQKHGKVRLLAVFEDFHGWDAHAAWDDLKFGMSHFADIDRIALVGDRSWEKWMAALSRPFTGAEVKYFDRTELDSAWKWIQEFS